MFGEVYAVPQHSFSGVPELKDKKTGVFAYLSLAVSQENLRAEQSQSLLKKDETSIAVPTLKLYGELHGLRLRLYREVDRVIDALATDVGSHDDQSVSQDATGGSDGQ